MKYNMEKWRSIIAECHTSDLSQKQFCQKNNLSYEAYRYWRKKINRIDSSLDEPCNQLVQYKLPSKPKTYSNYIFEWPDGMKLSIPEKISGEELTILVEKFRSETQ